MLSPHDLHPQFITPHRVNLKSLLLQCKSESVSPYDCFFSLSFWIYLLFKLLDIDPLWSVFKAKKWCANPAWIHLNTTPFPGLVGNLGALFGLGLAVNCDMFVQSCKGKNGNKSVFKLMWVTASLTFLQLHYFIKITTHSEILFYMLSFCKCASIPLSVVAVIPFCVHLLIRDEERKLS